MSEGPEANTGSQEVFERNERQAERKANARIAYASLIVGGLATVAACVQSLISWQAKDDFRQSVLLSEIVARCADLSPEVFSYTEQTILALLADVRPESAERTRRAYEQMRVDLHRKLYWLELVARSVDPNVAEELRMAASSEDEDPEVVLQTVVHVACEKLIDAKR